MPDIRTSCLLVEECDTPDEVRQQFDAVYDILRAFRAEIEAIKKENAALRKDQAAKQKGGK